MTLYRNVAGQEVFFSLVNAATGAGETGATVAVWITKNSGAQAAGAGTVDELGHGQYRYNFAAADTNAESVGLLLLAVGCVPVSFAWTTTPVPTVPVSGGTTVGNALVSLETAQRHLRLLVTTTTSTGSPATGSPGSPAGSPAAGSPSTTTDADLELKIIQASEVIRTYLLRPDDAAWSAAVQGWDETTVPAIVQAAVLYQLADLYLHRGDEAGRGPAGGICPEAEAVLRATGYRDPALA